MARLQCTDFAAPTPTTNATAHGLDCDGEGELALHCRYIYKEDDGMMVIAAKGF